MIKDARFVRDNAPDLLVRVRTGELKLNLAVAMTAARLVEQSQAVSNGSTDE